MAFMEKINSADNIRMAIYGLRYGMVFGLLGAIGAFFSFSDRTFIADFLYAIPLIAIVFYPFAIRNLKKKLEMTPLKRMSQGHH
jgi:hypothetical protein